MFGIPTEKEYLPLRIALQELGYELNKEFEPCIHDILNVRKWITIKITNLLKKLNKLNK